MNVEQVRALASPDGQALLRSLPPYDESSVFTLQASLRAPVHLTEGDRIELRGGAHNLTDAARSLQLVVAFGAQPPAQRDLQLAARAEAEVPLKAAV